ncbi:MAG: NnrS family protein, partial [Serpentinimonas sp.]|nr:NnrS family protein [Serpentinimonas sp.]
LSGDRPWTLGAMHAITMGFMGSLLLAMVTRVSCGHSGRTLVADRLVWGLFWLLQLATVLRVVADLADLRYLPGLTLPPRCSGRWHCCRGRCACCAGTACRASMVGRAEGQHGSRPPPAPASSLGRPVVAFFCRSLVLQQARAGHHLGR